MNTWILIKHAHRDYRGQVKALLPRSRGLRVYGYLCEAVLLSLSFLSLSFLSTLSSSFSISLYFMTVFPPADYPTRLKHLSFVVNRHPRVSPSTWRDKKALPEDSGYPPAMRRLNDESANVARNSRGRSDLRSDPHRIIFFDRGPTLRDGHALAYFAAGQRLTEIAGSRFSICSSSPFLSRLAAMETRDVTNSDEGYANAWSWFFDISVMSRDEIRCGMRTKINRDYAWTNDTSI